MIFMAEQKIDKIYEILSKKVKHYNVPLVDLIAEKLNEKYHSGESIRTKNSVISILYKLRKQKKKQKRKEEAKPSSQ